MTSTVKRVIRGTYATVAVRFGALCTWYDISETRICHLSLTESEYIAIDMYKGTLTTNCIEELAVDNTSTQFGFIPTLISFPKEFTITFECLNFIKSITFSSSTEIQAPSTSTLKSLFSSNPPTISNTKSFLHNWCLCFTYMQNKGKHNYG